LTCPARVALPVAALPPALLSGSLHHASLPYPAKDAEGRLAKIALKWMSNLKRARGRPKKNWM